MRYRYSHLIAMCYFSKEFHVDQIRDAVEYLKTEPMTEFTGLVAVTYYQSPNHRFKLEAKPMLNLNQILGKTPTEVWAMFDSDVDRQIRDLERRFEPRFSV